MNSALIVSACAGASASLPRFHDAMTLFAPHMPCEAPELRRVYLRLALRYHPDKCPKDDRVVATQLFQAIAAAYEELSKAAAPDGQRTSMTRVKTPTAAAAELGDMQELRRLLEELPSRATEEDEKGSCPLVFAAMGGCIEAAAMLLDYGADIGALNCCKWPAMVYAALHNHEAMVRFLVTRGAEVTVQDLTMTTWTGNPSALKGLVDNYKGSIAAARTNDGTPLLHLACEGLCLLKHDASMHAACVDMLLALDVPVDSVAPNSGRTCLQDFVSHRRWPTHKYESSKMHLDIVEALCLRGASVTLEDSSGKSALSIAAEAGLHSLRKLLYTYI